MSATLEFWFYSAAWKYSSFNLFCTCISFCEVEFHGPLSVQEDWIRHLQQHILKMNYDKPADSKLKLPEEKLLTLEAATSTCSTAFTTTALRMTPGHTRHPPTIHSCEGITVAATDITKLSEKHLASRVMSSVTV